MSQRILTSDEYGVFPLGIMSLLFGIVIGGLTTGAICSGAWVLLLLIPFVGWQWWNFFRLALITDTARQIVIKQLENIHNARDR